MSQTFSVDNNELFRRICGTQDSHIRLIESLTGASIVPRGNSLVVSSEKGNEEGLVAVFHELSDLLESRNRSDELDEFDIRYITRGYLSGQRVKSADLNRMKMKFRESGTTIVPRTENQAAYITSIFNRSVTFGIGPAGTGKTFLAVAAALQLFNRGEVERIILTRPAVEAGESLGFLPGDFMQKINPYLRPLYDALFDLFSGERVSALIEKGSIEIAPLAYMRGRTLNNSVIILDEAQNTTISQMKMFLTRLGYGSKIVISGDITQVDLHNNITSGLVHAQKILKNVEDIGFTRFTGEDITRHPVVERIVNAYEKAGGSK